MKVKVGDIVNSEFGTGPIVAMSNEWCIHKMSNYNDDEAAVEWSGVWLEANPDIDGGAMSSVEEAEVQGG